MNTINKLNTIASIEAYRKELNEALDNRLAYVKTCTRAGELADKSFGFIKESFESISPLLYESAEGKKLIGKYVSVIKESKDLSQLHTIFESVRKANAESNNAFFINSLAETNKVSKKKIEEGRKKLGKILAEAYVLLGESAEDKLPVDSPVYGAVEFIAESKKSAANLSEYAQAMSVIGDKINENKSGNIFVKKNVNESLAKVESLIENFNAKYEGELSDEEKAIIKKVNESKDTEEVFNEYKKICLESISDAQAIAKADGNEEDAMKLGEIFSRVNGKEFCNETVFSDICNLIEITKIF